MGRIGNSYQWVIKAFLLGVVFVFGFLSQVTFAAPLLVNATDSIAGYGSDISIKGGKLGENITIFVQPPLGKQLVYQKKIRGDTFSFSLPESTTTQAGKYKVVAVRKGLSFEDGPISSFVVFAGDTSSVDSKVENKNVSTPVGKNTEITVILRDKYFNPIEGDRVTLISSRSEDTIFPLQSTSNKRGEISFRVFSENEGVSTFTARDESANVTIRERAEVLFYQSGNKKNIGAPYKASLFSTASAQENENNFSGEVSSFKIGFPSIVKADSDENYLTITALDSEERVVKDFVGMVVVRIPTDANALLPGKNGKYIFKLKDQGVFTFPRAVVFPEVGNHKLEVFLYDESSEEINTNIYGKKSIKVQESDSGSGISTDDNVIVITYPSNKSTLTTREVHFRGTAKADTDIKIFLDNIPVKKVSVSSQGKFSTTLENVKDGSHFLYAMQTEGSQAASEEVSFEVKTSAGQYYSGGIFPRVVAPKGSVTLEIQAEKNLVTVEGMWNDESGFLKEVSDGEYVLTFTAPEKEGEYPVSVTLVNSSGIKTVKIVDTLSVVETKDLGDIILSGEFMIQDQLFDLSWNMKKGQEDPILYIIHAAKQGETLKKIKSVSGNTLKYAVDTLPIGEAYDFQITAVNSAGEETSTSNIVTLQSFELQTPKVTPTIVPSPKTLQFTAIGIQNGISLSWDKSDGAQQYVLQYGTTSGQYVETITLNGANNSHDLQDLIPGVAYYIRLISKDALGLTINNYGERVAIPLGSVYHPAPVQGPQVYPEWVTSTGPQLFLFIGAIFLMFGGVMMGRRERKNW